jgi:uncharacterized protein (TIGR02217 family)
VSFLETPRFPATIAFKAVGGPGYLTQVVSLKSGYEQRTSLWTYARMSWDVGSVVDTLSNYQPLLSFFRSVGGKRDGWRFQDVTDYTDAGAGVLGTTGLGDGTTTIFQMFKNYSSGANADQRAIRKPVSGTCAFFDNGSTVTPSVDYTTGLVTFGGAPTSGHTLTWTGQFDVPCRFDTDDLKWSIVDKRGTDFIMQWPAIPIVEIRV